MQRRYGKLFLIQWLIWLLAMLGLGGLVAYTLYSSHASTAAEANAQVQALTRLIDTNLSKQLESTDSVLKAVRDELGGLPEKKRFDPAQNEQLVRLQQALTGIRTLLVLDASGTARLSSRPELLGGNFSQRDYFQQPSRSLDAATLFVSPPFKTMLGAWVINLTRVIKDGKGQLAGVITATLDPDYFFTLLSSVRQGGDLRSIIIHGDGGVFFAVPDDSPVMGMNVKRAGTFFSRHTESGRTESLFTGAAPITGEQLLMVFRTIRPILVQMDKPLVVNIIRDHDAVFQAWRTNAAAYGWILAVTALTSCLLLAASQRRLRRHYAQLARADALMQHEHGQFVEAQRLAQVGSWELDLRTHRLSWSDEVFRLFEMDPAQFEASYEGFLNAIHPDDRATVQQAFADSLAKRQPYKVTHRLRLADGRIKWVCERGASEFDRDGKALRSFGTVQDITTLKQAQEVLRASEQKMQMVLDNAADAVMIASPQERWVYVNDQVAALLGYSREELVGTSIYDIVPPSHRALYRQEFGQLKAGRAQRRELRLIKKDGSRIPVEMNAVRLPDGNVYGAYRDFSEHKRNEESLRVAAAAFETEEGILITDGQGVILRVNQAFTRISGYSAEEAIGKTPALLQSGRQDQAFYRQMWGVLLQDSYWEGEVWNRRKNGEVYPEWLTITGVVNPQGKVSHYVAVFSDITERKAAEEQIHRLAFYDPLTQLPNRRLLHDRCEQALRSCARHKNHGAILFLDLDRFKLLNDAHGHDAGDQLLVQVAQRMLICVRAEDTVARMGGDEFVVVLEELSPELQIAREQARGVAEKIREALDQPYSLNGFTHHSSPSIGVCLFGDKTSTVTELLMHADVAMYQAKAAGRNTVCLFEA